VAVVVVAQERRMREGVERKIGISRRFIGVQLRCNELRLAEAWGLVCSSSSSNNNSSNNNSNSYNNNNSSYYNSSYNNSNNNNSSSYSYSNSNSSSYNISSSKTISCLLRLSKWSSTLPSPPPTTKGCTAAALDSQYYTNPRCPRQT